MSITVFLSEKLCTPQVGKLSLGWISQVTGLGNYLQPKKSRSKSRNSAWTIMWYIQDMKKKN